MTAETNAGNKDRFGRGGGSFKRNLVYELENLWKFVRLFSVNNHKPIACVQRDYCRSFHLANKAFAITCFGTTANRFSDVQLAARGPHITRRN